MRLPTCYQCVVNGFTLVVLTLKRSPFSEVQWTKPDDYVPEYENKFGKSDDAATNEQEAKEESLTTTHTVTTEGNEQDGKEQGAKEQEAEEQQPDPLPTCEIPLPTHEIPLPPPPGTETAPPPAPAPAPEPEPATEPERVDRKRPMPSSAAYGGWEQMPEPTQ